MVKNIVGALVSGREPASIYQRSNMSNVFSRACTLFVVAGALGMTACASPSRPSAIPAGKLAQAEEIGQLSRDLSSGLKAATLSQGVTDVTLANAGWTCVAPPIPFPFIICAPPGLGFPPFPPIPNNGGAPSYTLMVFTRDHQLDHHAKFLRPDLYQGQPCLGDEPWTLSARYNYNECIIPVRGTGR
jgi:hypothetical protein